MTAVAVETRINCAEYRVLARYANGETVRQIAAETGAPVKAVHSLIANVAENNKGRALKLVDEYEQARAQLAAALVDLLDDAEGTGDPILTERAETIRRLLGDLESAYGEHLKMRAEIRAALVDEAARIEARLAEIRTQLGAMDGQTGLLEAAA